MDVSEMMLEGPVGMHNNVHSLGVLRSSCLAVGGIVTAHPSWWTTSMKGLYTAAKNPKIEELQDWQIMVCSKPICKWCKHQVETLESLSGDSKESCGRPSKIPVRAMDSLVLGPLGVESWRHFWSHLCSHRSGGRHYHRQWTPCLQGTWDLDRVHISSGKSV